MQRAIGVTLTILFTAMFIVMVGLGNAESTTITEPQFSSVGLAIMIGASLFPIMWIAIIIQRHYWYRG